MKKYFVSAVLVLLIACGSIYSQKNDSTKAVIKKHRLLFSAGMGLALQNNSSFNDYLRRVIPYTSSDSIKSFTTGIEFFGGIEYTITKKFSLKLDYSYYLRSANYTYSYFTYNYDIIIHQPYLMGYYIFSKPSFDLRFGAGAGYHFTIVDDKPSNNSTFTYKAGGFSFRGEVVFAPYISKRLQAYLSGFVIGSSFSSLKDSNGNYLYSGNNSTQQVNLSGFGVGARIGFYYNLN